MTEDLQPAHSRSHINRRLRKLVPFLILLAFVACPFLYVNRQLARAESFIASHRFDDASEAINLAARLRLSSSRIAFLRARIARHRNQPKEFKHHLDRARAEGFSAERIDREQTLILASGGMASVLIDDLTRMLSNDYGDGAEYSAAFVQGFVSLGQTQQATMLLRQWEAVSPGDARLWYHRANLEFVNGKLLDAIKYYRRALDADPNFGDARLMCAKRLRTCKKLDEARIEFSKVLDSDPVNGLAKLGLGQTLIELGDQAAGTALLREIVDAPGVSTYEVRTALASVELEKDEPEIARQTLDPLLPEFAEDIDLNFLLLQIAIALGEEESQTTFAQRHAKLTEISNESSKEVEEIVAMSAEEALQFAQISMRIHWKTAKLALDIALSKAPQDPRVYEAMANYHNKAGDQEKASIFRYTARQLKQKTGTTSVTSDPSSG